MTHIARKKYYKTFLATLSRGTRRARPELWTSLEPEHKKEFLEFVFEAAHWDSHLSEWARKALCRDPGASPSKDPARNRLIEPGRQLVLTWQGPWGVVAPSRVSAATDELAATETLKRDRYAMSLWQEAKKRFELLKTDLTADEFGGSLELCTRTFQTGLVRLHLHACFASTGGRLERMELSALSVFGCLPHVQVEDARNQRKRRAAQWSGLYYVIAPKIGSLFTHTTARPHHEFEVNAEWIWSLVASHKIELSAARREIVGSGKNLARHLPNMDALEKEREKLVVQEIIRRRAVEIEKMRKAFKTLPSVVSWVRELSAPSDRRKFLMLDGETRLGKTAYAFSLVPPGAALEVNCAGCEYPPLRSFVRAKHRLILFDEASTDMVLKNKRLFQAPNGPVIMGSSPTNALAYEVFLGETLLVVASNNWEQELSALPAQQRAWLEGNMVFVSVKDKLYRAD